MAGIEDTTAGVAQPVEAADLKSAECRFESRRPHHEYLYVDTIVGRCVLRRRLPSGEWRLRAQRQRIRVDHGLRTKDATKAVDIARGVAPVLLGYGYSRNKKSLDGLPTAASYRRLFRSTRERARRKGIEFSLTDDVFQKIVNRAGGVCELTSVPFSLVKKKGWFRAPYSPSLDRIDSKLGYTFENVRLTCVAINWAMQDWGIEVFEDLCLGFLRGGRGAGILGKMNQPVETTKETEIAPGVFKSS